MPGLPPLQVGLVGCRAMIRESTKCFFRIGLYQPVMDALHPPTTEGVAPMWKRFAAGATSGATCAPRTPSRPLRGSRYARPGAGGRAALICNPLDLLKTRLQVQGSAFRSAAHASVEYSGIGDALGKMVRREGVRGMWKGTVVRRTPHPHPRNGR